MNESAQDGMHKLNSGDVEKVLHRLQEKLDTKIDNIPGIIERMEKAAQHGPSPYDGMTPISLRIDRHVHDISLENIEKIAARMADYMTMREREVREAGYTHPEREVVTRRYIA